MAVFAGAFGLTAATVIAIAAVGPVDDRAIVRPTFVYPPMRAGTHSMPYYIYTMQNVNGPHPIVGMTNSEP